MHDIGAAFDVAADLDALAELNATSGLLDNVVTVEWADFGPQTGLGIAPGTGATTGTLVNPVVTVVTPGVTPISMVPGEGFDALETVTLSAGEDADADLTDVYGSFILDVTAGDNAEVNLFNTEATSATVTAGLGLGDTADVTVEGDTIGNWSLTSLTVSGDIVNVELADNLASFTTLDVSSQSAPSSLMPPTLSTVRQQVTYLLGATANHPPSRQGRPSIPANSSTSLVVISVWSRSTSSKPATP